MQVPSPNTAPSLPPYSSQPPAGSPPLPLAAMPPGGYARGGSQATLTLLLFAFGVTLLVSLFQRGWFQSEMFGNRIDLGPSGAEICWGRELRKEVLGLEPSERLAAEKCKEIPLSSDVVKLGGVGDSAVFATSGMFAGFVTALGLLAAGTVFAFGMRVRFPAPMLRVVAVIALVACGYFQLRVSSLLDGHMGAAGFFGLSSLACAVVLAHRVVQVLAGPAGLAAAAPPPGWGPAPAGWGPPVAPLAPAPHHAMSFAAQSYDGGARPSPAASAVSAATGAATPAAKGAPTPAATVMGMAPVALGGVCPGCQRPLTYDLAGKRWFCRACGR